VHGSDSCDGTEGSAAARQHPKVFAVIPVHNRVEQTLRCLEALSAGTVATTAVVVDDGSTDGTADAVTRRHPGAVLLRGDGDLWWAGATNLGVAHALAHGADFVLTLNNDGVLASAAVEALLESTDVESRGLRSATRRDLAPPGDVVSVGVEFDWGGRRGWRNVPLEGEEPIPVDACGANALLVPRRCFEEIGLFDAERFPQCWADWDFELRARAAGWSLHTVPRSVVYEDRSTTGPRLIPRMSLRQAARLLLSRRSPWYVPGQVRFFRRHAPRRRVPALLLWRCQRLAKAMVRYHLR
jgi:GT2 family glycosyltransferase